MTTIQVISNQEFQQNLKDKVGTLMFPDELHNSTGYVDLVKLKKTLKDQIPKGRGRNAKKIVGVLVHTTSSPHFKNVANRQVHYKSPLCAHATQDGAYKKNCAYGGGEMWVSDHPAGDVIVVYQ
jgi:hypothetical protein